MQTKFYWLLARRLFLCSSKLQHVQPHTCIWSVVLFISIFSPRLQYMQGILHLSPVWVKVVRPSVGGHNLNPLAHLGYITFGCPSLMTWVGGLWWGHMDKSWYCNWHCSLAEACLSVHGQGCFHHLTECKQGWVAEGQENVCWIYLLVVGMTGSPWEGMAK